MGLWVDQEGTANPVISFTDGSTLIAPEEKVIAYESVTYNQTQVSGGLSNKWEGTSKTMRKLKDGDSVFFIAGTSNATDTTQVTGFVQLFVKH